MSDANIKARLDQLINLFTTQFEVKLADLCAALKVSIRTLKRYLEILEDMGYEFIYDKARKTYSLKLDE
jgi:DeoR/GlpR family transcriptional regulator of sugar metabolism